MTKEKFGTKGGDKKSRKTDTKTLFLIALLVVLLVIGCIVAVIFLSKRYNVDDSPVETPAVTGGRGIIATPDNLDEIPSPGSGTVQDGYYVTIMNFTWEFDSWDTPSSNAYVENNVDNTRTVYFDVLLDETKELVYSSPYLQVGTKIDGFALDKPLSAGEHSAVVTYHLVDDDYNEVTTVSVAVQLIIKG